MTTTAATPSTTAATAPASGASTAASALTTLSGNFSDFLSLLLTQLKNQDPASPMDSNSFTSELVQFTSVEQQINTNSSLTQLIQATQGSEVIQGTSTVGKTVTLSGTDVPLQGGAGQVGFTATTAQPVSVTLKNSAGVDVRDVSLTAVPGANTWTWDGKDNSGAVLPDGAYTATVTGSSGALAFTTTGTATGVSNDGGTVSLRVGAVTAPFSSVVSVGQ